MYICGNCDTMCCLVNPNSTGYFINSQLSLSEEITTCGDYSDMFHIVLPAPTLPIPVEVTEHSMTYQLMVQKYLLEEKIKMEKKIQEIADQYRKEFLEKFQKTQREKDLLFGRINAFVAKREASTITEDSPVVVKQEIFPPIVEEKALLSPIETLKKISDPKTPDYSPPKSVVDPKDRPASFDFPSRVILNKARSREKLQEISRTYVQAPVFSLEIEEGVIENLEEEGELLVQDDDSDDELPIEKHERTQSTTAKMDFMLSCSVPVRIPLPKLKPKAPIPKEKEENFWEDQQFSYIEKYEDVRNKFTKMEAK
jgi:hypothetical protein